MSEKTKPRARVEDDGERLAITVRPKKFGMLPFIEVLSLGSIACIAPSFMLILMRNFAVNFYVALTLIFFCAISFSSLAILARLFSRKQTITATPAGITILNRSLFYSKTTVCPREKISYLALSPHEIVPFPVFTGPLWLCLEDGKVVRFGLDLALKEAADLAGAISERTGIIGHRGPSKVKDPGKPYFLRGEQKVEVDDDGEKAVITITQKPRIKDLILPFIFLLVFLFWTGLLLAISISLALRGIVMGIVFVLPLMLMCLWAVNYYLKHFLFLLAGREVIAATPGRVTKRTDVFGIRGKTRTFEVEDMQIFSLTWYRMYNRGSIWFKTGRKIHWLAQESSLVDAYVMAGLIKERSGIGDDLSLGL